MKIRKKLEIIKKELNKYHNVKLVLVCKNHSADEVNQAIESGVRCLGENRIQEARDKFPLLLKPELFAEDHKDFHITKPKEQIKTERHLSFVLTKDKKGLEKHFIGHLQKNKVKKAISLFDMIESVDSFSLAEKINEIAKELGKKVPILLQVNISRDNKKFGFLPEEIKKVAEDIAKMKNIDVHGLMSITQNEENPEKSRPHFRRLHMLFQKFKKAEIFGRKFTEISMGMSQDYKIALEEGATIIRVGSFVFN